jgi:hypothetical protein
MGASAVATAADTFAQGCPREVNLLARKDLLQPVERQVIDVLRNDDVCEKPLAGERFLDRLRRHPRFHHASVAMRTCVLRGGPFR